MRLSKEGWKFGPKKRIMPKKELVYHDLDHLSGGWSKEESQQFERNLKDQRHIDEDIWK